MTTHREGLPHSTTTILHLFPDSLTDRLFWCCKVVVPVYTTTKAYITQILESLAVELLSEALQQTQAHHI
ncbi:unnamed protein product [Brugia pahangi]|uniref:Uncharacterized protein n=1 Tax=Brugia pahangi TaxID=6280 RepID=A0A0N4T2D2_BRUPA|nr:unnamed protein product [Brugia pahangi]